MNNTPKSLRLHIGLFGRTNVGKSSFLNFITGQDVSITSIIPGTTTDVVEKSMELLPIGPVVFLDTAGLDDSTELGTDRIKKSRKIYERSDVIFLIIESMIWTEHEINVINETQKRKIPVIIVVNKIDITRPTEDFLSKLKDFSQYLIMSSCTDISLRDTIVNKLKDALIHICPDDFLKPPQLIGDLVSSGGVVVLIIPIDLEAPKGRLILPQVQTIRDALDNDALCLITKEREYSYALKQLAHEPNIVVCDSQVVLKMVGDTPKNIKCTTFSILFARYKGDLIEAARGAARLETLKANDRVLIAEACSHHAIEDDIGRVKIPRWIKQFAGGGITIDVVSGKDYPDDLHTYSVIIHCGGCMFNRREMLSRITKAKEANVPITNYGVCISVLQGVIQRVLEPFPAALNAYINEKARTRI
jgi:[FeFe] hydrogenase H-cluster maturation GTPase HydF